jgi:type II restriction enzyme
MLFEIGSNKLLIGNEHSLSTAEREKIEKALSKRRKEVKEDDEQGNLHSEMQSHLLKIGSELGYDVTCASNDRSRCHAGTSLGALSMPDFPSLPVSESTGKTIRLIDVLWFEKDSNRVTAAFEVEKSTTITSGMGRMIDLHYFFPDSASSLYIVIPDKREKELQLLMQRPSVRATHVGVNMHYILFSDLKKHCDAICMFGDSKDALQKIAEKAGAWND